MTRRKQRLIGEVGSFVQQYARKAPRHGEPNDRGYNREIELLVQKMKPEELDEIINGTQESKPSTPTEVKIVAKSDQEVFIGMDSKGTCCVFVLEGQESLDLNQILHGVFDDSDGLFKHVDQVSTGHRMRIALELWGCSSHKAWNVLNSLNNPTAITVLPGIVVV